MMCFHILKWPMVPIWVIGINRETKERTITSNLSTNQEPERGEEGGAAARRQLN